MPHDEHEGRTGGGGGGGVDGEKSGKEKEGMGKGKPGGPVIAAQQALGEALTVLPPDGLDITYFQELLGKCYMLEGDFKSASMYIATAAKKRLQLFGEHHPDRAR